uniref:Putative eukaryotic translation initiation factor 3 subunit m n=1 Tax=Ixodes ricinus TaxID=34613 RepID=A0A0K8RN20_IXORI
MTARMDTMLFSTASMSASLASLKHTSHTPMICWTFRARLSGTCSSEMSAPKPLRYERSSRHWSSTPMSMNVGILMIGFVAGTDLPVFSGVDKSRVTRTIWTPRAPPYRTYVRSDLSCVTTYQW